LRTRLRAPCKLVVFAVRGKPRFDDELGDDRALLAVGGGGEIAQPGEAVRPFAPRERRLDEREIQPPHGLGMTAESKAARCDFAAAIGIAADGVGWSREDLERRPAAQLAAVERRGVTKLRQAFGNAFADRAAKAAGRAGQPLARRIVAAAVVAHAAASPLSRAMLAA
jgi:hypothetical protein